MKNEAFAAACARNSVNIPSQNMKCKLQKNVAFYDSSLLMNLI